MIEGWQMLSVHAIWRLLLYEYICALCIRAVSFCCRSVSGLLERLGTLNTFPALWVSLSVWIISFYFTFPYRQLLISTISCFVFKNCQKSLTEGTGFHEHKGRYRNIFLSILISKEPGTFKVPVKLWRVCLETILPHVWLGPKSHQIICGNRYQY